jgi:hypothetical protein
MKTLTQRVTDAQCCQCSQGFSGSEECDGKPNGANWLVSGPLCSRTLCKREALRRAASPTYDDLKPESKTESRRGSVLPVGALAFRQGR